MAQAFLKANLVDTYGVNKSFVKQISVISPVLCYQSVKWKQVTKRATITHLRVIKIILIDLNFQDQVTPLSVI